MDVRVGTVKKAEHRRIDAFELWCWRRLLRVPWTARRSNHSILKEIGPGCSLEGMMLKLKLQYFGHLMQRVHSFVLVFDAFVIVICLASLILCTRSIVLALRLRKVNVCWNILPHFLTSAFSLSKQWGLDEGLSCPMWGLD